ncbi:MAG: transporter [Frankiales bacterium]|nr:transporter [Frankiales bacterium]
MTVTVTRDTAARQERGSRLRRSSPSSQTLILFVILTCQLMVVLDATIVNVALPDIQRALHFSPASLSWVLNAYTLTFGGLLLLGARAGDILGRRRTFLTGIGVFIVASLVGGFAPSGGFLLAARAAQGIGGAIAAPSALALLTTMFSEGRERMRALGLYTAVSIGGSAVGLVVGGMLTQWVSWRWVLFVNVPIGIGVLAVGRAVLPETPRHEGRFDLPGALTSTFGMGSLVYGFVRAATDGWSDALSVTAFVAGVVLLVGFVHIERHAPSPITPLRLLTDRNRSSANAARGLLVAGMFGMFFFMTQFLQDVLGYSPLKTGIAFLPLTATLFAASQLSSRLLVHKVSAKLLIAGGITLSAVGLLLLTQLSASTGYPEVLLSLLLVGAGNGSAFVPLTSAALVGVAPADAGAASGLVNAVQQVGGALGVAVLVTIFGSASRHAASHPQPGWNALQQAHHAFVYGADRAFLASAMFLVAAIALIAIALQTHTAVSADR